MLSIGKLGQSSEDYYLSAVASGAEEYYTGAGEAPGHWLGKGAAALDLAGEVTRSELHLVLEGISPGDMTPLSRYTRHANRVSGLDLTFSAPKSASVLYGLGTPEMAGAVKDAHEAAMADAIGYLERHAPLARRGAGGSRRIATTGMVAAAFTHRTSRNGDPQLHTHVVVANVVQGTDGQWSAPDAGLLYHHARTAGFLYQASLRHHLAGRLGVRFTPVERGAAEIKGMDPLLIRAFSTRRREIEAALERSGGTSGKARELAALSTRRPKDHAHSPDAPSLRDRWREQAADLGVDPSHLVALTGPPRTVTVNEHDAQALVTHLMGPTGLTEHASHFVRRDALRAVAEALPDGAPVETVEALADRVIGSPGAVPLADTDRGAELRHTTKDILDTEDRLLKAARERLGAGVGLVPGPTRTKALKRHQHLSDEQRAMVEEITTSGDGVTVVVGQAGAGKTTALAATREALEAHGYRVTGTALSARAAKGLEEEAGIPSLTIAKLRKEIEEGARHFTERDILVIDEAAMVGTRDLEALMSEADRAGAKVVLVGDPRQLPEIEAGGAFGTLATDPRFHPVTLTENRRQRERWERLALADLREGEVTPALSAYLDHDRVHLAENLSGAEDQMVEAWQQARAEDGTTVMLAVSRRDVAELNARARAARKEEGALGHDLPVPGAFATGDEVVALRNDQRLGVMNGTRGTVTGEADGQLLIETKEGEIALPPEYVEEHVDHAYALTVHKSQGATYDRALVLATDSMSRETGYVAMSRARERTDLFVPTSPIEDGREPAEGQDKDPLVPVARRLATSRAQTLATSHLGEDERQPIMDAPVPTVTDTTEPVMAQDTGAPTPTTADAGPPEQPREANPPAPPRPDISEEEPPAPLPERPNQRSGTNAATDPDTGGAPDPVIATIGPRPHSALQRLTYDRAAQLITDYRESYDVKDKTSPLGERPEGGTARVRYDLATRAIDDYERRRAREQEPHVRSRELDPRDLGRGW